MNIKLRRRHKESEAPTTEAGVVASTVERAQAHMVRMPLAGPRPLHNDETIALWKFKRALTEFYGR